MAEAHDDPFGGELFVEPGFGAVDRTDRGEHLEHLLVGAAVERALQGADRRSDRGVHVRARTRYDARRESGCVVLVFGIQVERRVHGTHPQIGRLLAVEQMQKVSADGVIIGFHVNTLAVVAVVIPVEQHRAERGHQLIGDVARTRGRMVVFLGKLTAKRRYASTHDVHRMSGCRKPLEHGFHIGGHAAERLQLGLVAREFGCSGELAVHQQVGNFLELGGFGDIENVIAPIVKVVAAAAHGTEGGVAGGNARQGD